MEYYYLGLEARVRDNKFPTLEEAKIRALESANYFGTPVRIFGMDAERRSTLIEEIQPQKYLKV